MILQLAQKAKAEFSSVFSSFHAKIMMRASKAPPQSCRQFQIKFNRIIVLSFLRVTFDQNQKGHPPGIRAQLHPAHLRPRMQVDISSSSSSSIAVVIITLLARSLASYGFRPINNSLVEMDCVDAEAKTHTVMSRNSNNPTGSDPNFCQILKMKLALPRDANFAPVLTIRSVDHRLFGASKPTVGSCRFDKISKFSLFTMKTLAMMQFFKQISASAWNAA
jgi:hypothetical protein